MKITGGQEKKQDLRHLFFPKGDETEELTRFWNFSSISKYLEKRELSGQCFFSLLWLKRGGNRKKKKGVTEWVNKDADMLMEVKFMVSHWIGDDLKLKGISLAQGNRAYFPTGEGGKVGEGRERERENRLQI